jgi:hypothetical protein
MPAALWDVNTAEFSHRGKSIARGKKDLTVDKVSKIIPAMRFSRSPAKSRSAPNTLSRREFAQTAALAAATLSPSATRLVAGVPSAPVSANGAPQAQPDNLGLNPAQKLEVEAKLTNIVRKYGSRLSKEQREHIGHILGYNEKMLASIRNFPLENGDAPATVLKLAAGEDSK